MSIADTILNYLHESKSTKIPTFMKITEVSESQFSIVIGDLEFIANIEDEDEVGMIFSNGNKPFTHYLDNAYSFIGYIFHIIQQTGGILKYKDRLLQANDIDTTSGSELVEEDLVRYNNSVVQLKNVLKNFKFK